MMYLIMKFGNSEFCNSVCGNEGFGHNELGNDVFCKRVMVDWYMFIS